MIKTLHKGFSVIELLVTLFVAVGFLYAGYQLYTVVVIDGNLTRSESRASNLALSYLKQYSNSTSTTCVASNFLTDSAVTTSGLTGVLVSVSITCPYPASTSLSKVTVTVKYNSPQKTVTIASYVDKANTVFKAPITCPTGFIPVPGSATYSTSNFCVMKYEAKCALTASPTVGLSTSSNTYSNLTTACTSANSRGIVSTSSGFPIANIDQTTSTTYAANTIGCSGCTLMSEAQWLTIAQNVLSNPVNWSGNAVGSGYIYSGHNDNSPGNALEASDDSNGYSGTEQSSGNQKRTLTLTNGETIWDLAGNAAEWTSGQKTGGQPSPAGYAWREWTAVSGGTISPSPFPATTGLSGASTWNSSNGIGQIYSNSADATLRGFIRGGGWNYGSFTGVLTLNLPVTPTYTISTLGFRVTK